MAKKTNFNLNITEWVVKRERLKQLTYSIYNVHTGMGSCISFYGKLGQVKMCICAEAEQERWWWRGGGWQGKSEFIHIYGGQHQ